jgi:hypothetical protein
MKNSNQGNVLMQREGAAPAAVGLKKRPSKQGGFVMGELLLAVGIIAVVAVGAFLAYRALSADTASDKQIAGVVDFVGKSKEIFGAAGSWTTFTVPNMVHLNRLPPQFTSDATSGSEVIYDANKNPVTLTAATNQGTVQLTTVSQEECSKIGQRLADLTYTMSVGPTASLSVVKSATQTFSVTNLATGCSGTTPVIQMVIR